MKKLFLIVMTILLFAFTANAAENITLSNFATYQSKFYGYEAKIVTPIVSGLADKKAENEMNKTFMRKAKKLVAEYEDSVIQMIKEVPTKQGHFGLLSDFIIKTDNENILAFDSYVFSVVGSSSTKHEFYTFNKKRGELMTLKETLKHYPDYVSTISKYIKAKMVTLNKKRNGMFWIEKGSPEEFKRIKDDQNFYINYNGALVICFDKYEVAAGAQGSPEFVIPSNIIKIDL